MGAHHSAAEFQRSWTWRRMAARISVVGVLAAVGVLLPVTAAQAASPTVTIDQGASQPDPTSTAPIVFDVVFSEPVSGFTQAGVLLTASAGGSLAAAVAGSGATYTVTVTGMTTPGAVIATIAAGAAVNGTGEATMASTSIDNTVMWNPTAPTVTIDQSASQTDPTSTAPIAFDVVFNQPVTGFTAADVTLSGTAGGSLTGAVAGSGATYTVTVTGMTTAGTVIATIGAGAAVSAADIPSMASTSIDNTVMWSPTAPTVTIDQSASQTDPTSTAPIAFDVVFNQPVTGFTAADVTLSGTAGGLLTGAVAGSGATYTVSVTGMTTAGTVIATIAAGAAFSAAGVPSLASTSVDNTVTWAPSGEPSVTPTPTPTVSTGSSSTTGGALAVTGTTITWLLVSAAVLIGGGVAALLVARRRRVHVES